MGKELQDALQGPVFGPLGKPPSGASLVLASTVHLAWHHWECKLEQGI